MIEFARKSVSQGTRQKISQALKRKKRGGKKKAGVSVKDFLTKPATTRAGNAARTAVIGAGINTAVSGIENFGHGAKYVDTPGNRIRVPEGMSRNKAKTITGLANAARMTPASALVGAGIGAVGGAATYQKPRVLPAKKRKKK